MTPEELYFKDATEALNKKDFPKARDLFTRLLKLNRQNPEYWIGMSLAVDTLKERGVCLREALKLDPENELAKRGLILMGEKVENPPPDWKMSQLKQDWKTSLEIARDNKVHTKVPVRKILGWSFLGLLLAAIITGGILIAENNRYRPDTSPVLRVTLAPTATASDTPTVTATSFGPPLLDTHLEATFTPTTIYAATPHNRSEAYSSALRAFDRQDYGRAVELLKQVILEEPGSADLQYLLGESYRMQKNYREALAAYDAAIKANGSYAPSYLGKGRVTLVYTPTRSDDALKYFYKALELDPDLNEAKLELANLYLSKGDTDSALSWLENYVSNAPATAVIEYTRAKILLQNGEMNAALASVENARQMDRSYMPVYSLWGQILQANNMYEESILPLLTYLNADPDDSQGQLLLATAYYQTGQVDLALETIQKVLNVDSKTIDAFLLRGDIYMDQGKLDEADNSFLRAQQLYYRSFGGYIGRARVQLAKTYAGKAYSIIEQAMDAASTPREEAIALYWRAVSLVGLKETGASIRDYEAFLALPEGVAPAKLVSQAKTEYLAIVTPTPSMTATNTFTPTSSSTPTVTFTPRPTNTPTRTFTITVTSSRTPTATATATNSKTPTPSPTK
jgi:tetratricopeptide (TPR) repeat protein